MINHQEVNYSHYPRVTEILSRLRDYSHINQTVFEEKGLIGSEVHKNIYEEENFGFPIFSLFPMRDRNGEVKVDEEGKEVWQRRGMGYYNSYLKWKEKNNPHYILHPRPDVETDGRFYDHDLMIRGQIDALIKLESYSKPVLIDFKCSYSVDEEIWGMQAHFYKHLLKINGIETEDFFIWIQLKKDGAKPRELRIDFDENTLSRCCQEAVLFWEEKNQSKSIDF